MKGKVALITGSATGIGFSIAKRLAEAGADVVINARTNEKLIEAQMRLRDFGFVVHAERFDASDVVEVDAAVARILAKKGRLAFLVNNAGVLLPKTISETSIEEWDWVMKNNVNSAFVCSKATMAVFERQGDGGRIINIGSTAGQRGAPAGALAYSTSKAALGGLTKTLAFTGAEHKVTVNMVAPGMIETEMLRLGFGDKLPDVAQALPLGLGQPTDIAEAVLFLASEAGRYVTGATIDVNGGIYHR